MMLQSTPSSQRNVKPWYQQLIVPGGVAFGLVGQADAAMDAAILHRIYLAAYAPEDDVFSQNLARQEVAFRISSANAATYQ